MASIWTCKPSCTNCVFHVLEEVGSWKKVTIEDPSTLLTCIMPLDFNPARDSKGALSCPKFHLISSPFRKKPPRRLVCVVDGDEGLLCHERRVPHYNS